MRYLKGAQIYRRAWFLLRRPSPDLKPAPTQCIQVNRWQPCPLRKQSLLAPNRFAFLNEAHELTSASDWNNETWTRLWLYNLHYFDDLNAAGAERREDWRRSLIERWIVENPPAKGVGWKPYPLSLRIVNWIKWGLSGHPLSKEMNNSLAVQTRYLRSRLEYHLLGNHLLANAKALVFAGLWFEGSEADVWFETGQEIFRSQLKEQVLDDGGHFERSPMYHAIVLEDCLDLINLFMTFGRDVPGWLLSVVPRMQDWLRAMCHPDGEIAFFNDAAFGVAAREIELKDYAQRLAIGDASKNFPPLTHLAASGYVRVEKGDAVALLDVAPLGPDYLPAHGHADTLSFELSLHGKRLVVNSGTSRYDVSPERVEERGTAAHNTLVLDGTNSSDVWASFRVGRRARVISVSSSEVDGALFIRAAQDGYSHLRGRPLHSRTWRFDEKSLEIEDELKGSGEHSVELMFHLHPDIQVTLCSNRCSLALAEGREIATVRLDDKLSALITESAFHPEFGLEMKNSCVIGKWRGFLPVRFVCKLLYASSA